MYKISSRRSFFGKAAAVDGTVASESHNAQAQTKPKIPTTDLHRIGVIALGDNLPDNWGAPCPYADWIDETIF